MGMSQDHVDWPRLPYREQFKERDEEADRGNVKEWTGLEWNIILRKAENREELRKLVVKSTVVLKWSARLRDRLDKITNPSL